MTQSDAHLRTYPTAEPASVGELTSRLGEQVSRLVRDELALAQVEAKQKAKRLGLGAGLFGMSGLLAVFGLMCGIAAAVLGLANAVPGWLAALIVAAALFAVAGIAAMTGKRDIKRGSPPVPTEAVSSSKHDIEAVREAVAR